VSKTFITHIKYETGAHAQLSFSPHQPSAAHEQNLDTITYWSNPSAKILNPQAPI